MKRILTLAMAICLSAGCGGPVFFPSTRRLDPEEARLREISALEFGEGDPAGRVQRILVIAEELEEEHEHVAVMALARIDEPAVPLLQSIMADKTASLRSRRIAAHALVSALADDERLHKLAVAWLADPQEHVDIKIAAVTALRDSELRPAARRVVAAAIRGGSTLMVREQGINLAGLWRVEEAVPALVEEITEPKQKYLTHALSALKQIGDASLPAVPRLCQIAGDKGHGERWNAIEALAAIPSGKEQSVPVLVAIVEDRADHTANVAGQALGKLAPARPEVIAALTARVDDPNPDVASWCAQALAEGGEASRLSVPAVLKVLDAQHAEARRGAVAALVRWGPIAGEAVPRLLTLIKTEKDDETLWGAIRALGGMGEAGKLALADLHLLLQDPSWRVREAAVGALSQLKASDEATVEALARFLTFQPIDASQLCAAAALEKLGPKAKAALPTLRKIVLTSKHHALPEYAARAIHAIGDEEDLLTLLPRPELAGQIEHSLQKLGGEALPFLQRGLRHDDPLVRRAAAFWLGKRLRQPEAVAALEAARRDDDLRVRAAAVEALGGAAFRDSSGDLPAILELLPTSPADHYPPAMHALRYRAGGAQLLIELLVDESRPEGLRLAAAAEIEPSLIKEAAPRLRAGLASKTARIRAQAAILLARSWNADREVARELGAGMQQSRDLQLRRECVSAANDVRQHREEMAAGLLHVIQHGKDAEVRMWAAQQLGTTPIPEQHRALAAELASDPAAKEYMEIVARRRETEAAPKPDDQPKNAERGLALLARAKTSEEFDAAFDRMSETVLNDRGTPRDPTAAELELADRLLALADREQRCWPLLNLLPRLLHGGPEPFRRIVVLLDRHPGVGPNAQHALKECGWEAVPLWAEQLSTKDPKRLDFLLGVWEDRGSASRQDKWWLAPAAPALERICLANDKQFSPRAADLLWQASGRDEAVVAGLLPAFTEGDLPQVLRASRILNPVAAANPAAAAKAIPVLEKLLAHRDPDFRAIAAAILAHRGMRPEAALPYLVKALRGEPYPQPEEPPHAVGSVRLGDPRVQREQALEGLARIGPKAKEHLPLILERFREMYAGEYAGQAIVALGPEAASAVPELLALARVAGTSHAALRTLGGLGTTARAAAPELARWLLDERGDSNLADDVALALGRIGGPEAERAAVELAARLDRQGQEAATLTLLARLGPSAKPAIPKIAALLDSQSDATAKAAFAALSELKQEARDALPALRRQLDRGDDQRRVWAIGTIGELRGEGAAALPRVIELTQSSHEKTRDTAIMVLGEIGGGDPGMAARLATFLKNSETQFEALYALEMLGGEARPALPAIKAVWKDRSSSYRYRAGELLFKLGAASPER